MTRMSKKFAFNQWPISSTFYARFFHRYPFAKKITKLKRTREKLSKAHLYKKIRSLNVDEIDSRMYVCSLALQLCSKKIV